MANLVLSKLDDILGIDLDICISDEMKENFSRGIYPSSDERIDFMEKACKLYMLNFIKD